MRTLPEPHRQIVVYRDDGVAEREEEEPEPGMKGFLGEPDAVVGFEAAALTDDRRKNLRFFGLFSTEFQQVEFFNPLQN